MVNPWVSNPTKNTGKKMKITRLEVKIPNFPKNVWVRNFFLPKTLLKICTIDSIEP